jgi:hypothetical protein
VEVAERALDPESLGPQGLKLRAPGHEHDLVTSRSQPTAEVAAYASGAHHGDPHSHLHG